MSADRKNRAALHDQDAVRVLDRSRPLRDNDFRRLRDKFPHRPADQRVRFCINRTRRIIQNKDFRLL